MAYTEGWALGALRAGAGPGGVRTTHQADSPALLTGGCRHRCCCPGRLERLYSVTSLPLQLFSSPFLKAPLKRGAEKSLFPFFFLINLFILFLAVLGLCCCARAFPSCGEQGLLFVAVRGLLIAVASLVVEHGL